MNNSRARDLISYHPEKLPPCHRPFLASPVEPFIQGSRSHSDVPTDPARIPTHSIILYMAHQMALEICNHCLSAFDSHFPECLIQQVQFLDEPLPLCLPPYHETTTATLGYKVRKSKEIECLGSAQPIPMTIRVGFAPTELRDLARPQLGRDRPIQQHFMTKIFLKSETQGQGFQTITQPSEQD